MARKFRSARRCVGRNRRAREYHDPPPRRGHSRDHDHHGGFDDRGRVPEREHRMQSREWDGGRNHVNDRYAPASERMERYGREEDRNGRREHVRRESSRDAFRRSARGDDSARRTSASRKPDYSESDSSETEYTRKPRQWDVTLTPHEQLEALDLWLKAIPRWRERLTNSTSVLQVPTHSSLHLSSKTVIGCASRARSTTGRIA